MRKKDRRPMKKLTHRKLNLKTKNIINFSFTMIFKMIVRIYKIVLIIYINLVEASEKQDESLCIVCLTNKRNALFYKCGHNVACIDCSNAIRRDKCPVCFQIIKDVVKMYQ